MSSDDEQPRDPEAPQEPVESSPSAGADHADVPEREEQPAVVHQPMVVPSQPGMVLHPGFVLDPDRLPPGAVPPPPPGLPGFVPPVSEDEPGSRVVWVAATVPVFMHEMATSDRRRRSAEVPERASYTQLDPEAFARRAAQASAEVPEEKQSGVAPALWLVWGGAGAAAIFLAVLAFALLNGLFNQAEPFEPEIASAAQRTEAPTDNSIDGLMERFVSENGGRGNLASMHTMLVRGEMSRDGEVFSVYNLKRRPDDFYIRLRRDNVQIGIGIHDDDAWQAIENTDTGARLVDDMSPEARQAFGRLTNFFHPFTRFAVEGAGTVSDHEQLETASGEPLRRITFRPADSEHAFTVELEGDDLLLTSSEYTDDAGRVFRSEFREHQQVLGLWLPYLVRNYVDGELETSLDVDTIQLNPGLISLVFERPEPYIPDQG